MISILTFTIAAFFATNNQPPVTCLTNDAPCWKRALEYQLILDDSLKTELGLTQKSVQNALEHVDALKGINIVLKGSLEQMVPALQGSKRSWHEAPQLWFGIGVASGILLTAGLLIISVWAVGQISLAH